MGIYESQFWKDTGERVVSSAAQGFLTGAGIAGGADALGELDIRGFPWLAAAAGAGGMAVLTFIKSLLAGPFGSKGTAGFTKAVQKAPEQDMVRRSKKRPRKATKAVVPPGVTPTPGQSPQTPTPGRPRHAADEV